MEIVTEHVQTGQEIREAILREFGSADALRSKADSGDPEAQENLAVLRILEKEPDRLGSPWKTVTVSTLAPTDIEALTTKRLQLLERVQTTRNPTVTGLAASLQRDKKNVSEDLKMLARLGLIRLERSGREASPKSLANEIRIRLGPAPDPSRHPRRRPVAKRPAGRSPNSRAANRSVRRRGKALRP